jgi:hypothetical protein
MAEPTQASDTATTPTPAAYGWCSWHEGYSSGVRLINVHEQGSGPGASVYACGPCSETHRLVPFGERP